MRYLSAGVCLVVVCSSAGAQDLPSASRVRAESRDVRALVAEAVSRSSGLPCVFGRTPDGTFIIVVYELIDEDTIYPVTAYEVPEP